MPSFNLIDEKWILLNSGDMASLKDVFSLDFPHFIAGNPIELLAIFKLLMAIAQAAVKVTNQEYQTLTTAQLSERVLAYLELHQDKFDLYDPEVPFLQYPQVKTAKTEKLNALTLGKISPSSNTVVTHHAQIFSEHDDPTMARTIVQLMGFAMGGKKGDSKVILEPNYEKKPTAATGTSLGGLGAAHSFFKAKTLIDTILINLFTTEQIASMGHFSHGLGVAPWENMPKTEADSTAEALKNSLMGRLIPMNRFCLIQHTGQGEIHITEGLKHMGYSEGFYDPTMTYRIPNPKLKRSEDPIKKPTLVFCRHSRSIWRAVPAILSFLDSESSASFNFQVKYGLLNAQVKSIPELTLISTGLEFTTTSGECSVNGRSDFHYSEMSILVEHLDSIGYAKLKLIFNEMESYSKILYTTSMRYAKELGLTSQDAIYPKVERKFWSTAKTIIQQYLKEMGQADALNHARQQLRTACLTAYDVLPHSGSRTTPVFYKNRPILKRVI